MKKVLIITYYWPPSGGAGVQRWLKFVKYLPQFGWEPIVYTVDNGEYPVIDNSLLDDISKNVTVLKTPIWEPYDYYKKLTGRKKEDKINSGFLSENKNPKFLEELSKWIRGNLFIPDARMFWIKPSIKYLINYLKKNPVDLIITSGPPHSTHLIGLRLKQTLQIPWVADFRDPWTNIDFYQELKLSKWADKKHRNLEKKVLTNSDLVLTIGENLKNELIKLGGKNVQIVENGYDEDDFTEEENINIDNEFTIAHIGSFTPSRNHNVLWQSLKELTLENVEFKKQLKIKLIGKVDHSVYNSVRKFSLESHILSLGYMSHNKVIEEQKKSKVLLLMVNNTPNAKGIITGKIFEYIASGRPVLVIGPKDGDLSQIINNTKCGIVCDFNDVSDLKSALISLFQNKLSFSSDASYYTRINLTEKLSNLLENVSE